MSRGRFDPQEMELPPDPEASRGIEDTRFSGSGSPSPPPPPVAQTVINQKHREYLKRARFYRWLYYGTRLIAGLSAGFLLFVVSSNPYIARTLSILIVLSAVLDSVLDPRTNWRLYSRATDLLVIADLKARGQYDDYKERLDILVATEADRLERLVDLKELLQNIKQSPTSQG